MQRRIERNQPTVLQLTASGWCSGCWGCRCRCRIESKPGPAARGTFEFESAPKLCSEKRNPGTRGATGWAAASPQALSIRFGSVRVAGADRLRLAQRRGLPGGWAQLHDAQTTHDSHPHANATRACPARWCGNPPSWSTSPRNSWTRQSCRHLRLRPVERILRALWHAAERSKEATFAGHDSGCGARCSEHGGCR